MLCILCSLLSLSQQLLHFCQLALVVELFLQGLALLQVEALASASHEDRDWPKRQILNSPRKWLAPGDAGVHSPA